VARFCSWQLWCYEALQSLNIKVAERPFSRIHNSTDGRRLRRIPHVERVVEPSFSRLRLVRPSDVSVVATVHFCLGEAANRVEQLPVRPHPVHHSVMDVKCWVAWRGEEVAAGIAAGRVLGLVLRVFVDDVDLPDHVVSTPVRANFDCIGSSFGKAAVFGDVRLRQEV
jgi:hypothetical protein